MASPITGSSFDIQNFSGDVCERIRKLLEINDTLKTFFTWMFNSDGTLTDSFKVLMQDVAVAVGTVIFRPISSIPSGYLHCNGQAVSRTIYANLFAVFGTTFGTGDGSTTFNLPDFDGLFLMGSGPAGANPVGSTGGAATVTLTTAQIPAHTHGPGSPDGDSSGFLEKTAVGGKTYDVSASGDGVVSTATGSTGGGQAHDNLPPYFAGKWLVKY